MEFVQKLLKNDLIYTSVRYKIFWVSKYFDQSEITKEKIDFIENRTGLNLSKFRMMKEVKALSPF